MTITPNISQNDSTNCNFSTTNINSEVESTNFITSISTDLSNSSYRKNYIAWDKLERANKPDSYTEKTKYLSKNAKALLSVVYQKLKRQPVLLLNHKYISTITGAGSRQNQNVINELGELLDISYHRSTEDHKGKKYEYVYKFTHKKVHTDSSGDGMIRKKISVSSPPSTYIDKNNIINNRSRANFVKNSSGSFSVEKNSRLEPKNKDYEIKEKEDRVGWNSEENQESKKNLKSANKILPEQTHTKPKETIATLTTNTNGFLGSGKYLHEVLDHLTDEMCSLIRTKCGKDFTNKAIREIAKAVSRSKKGAKAFFYHIKGFIAYLSKILTFEKRDPVKISSTNYYITANQTNEEQVMRKQEKYLIDVEYSLQVSPEWHLKKKLAATLERSKAYNLLTSYKSLKISNKGRAVITLNNDVPLSNSDKELILSQIQATHEKMDDAGNYQPVESLEIITQGKPMALNASESQGENFLKREGVWGKIRETFASYFGSEGDAIDKSWLSNFNANIDNRKKTIELQAPSRFIKDWVESNYLCYIEDAAKVNGLIIKCIK